MIKRMILMLVIVAAFVGALAAYKAHQVKGAMAQGAAFKPPPEAVTTTVARQEVWSSTVKSIGTATAVQGGGGAVATGPAKPVVKSDIETIGRNDPCWCGSGKKYKKCHGA